MSREIIIEESERLDGVVAQTIRLANGQEIVRLAPYRCPICNAPSNRPFPKAAISCLRADCRIADPNYGCAP